MQSTTGENYFQMRKNGEPICYGYIRSENAYGTGYCDANVQLELGDQVYVTADGHFNGLYAGFSGFLVKAL